MACNLGHLVEPHRAVHADPCSGFAFEVFLPLGHCIPRLVDLTCPWFLLDPLPAKANELGRMHYQLLTRRLATLVQIMSSGYVIAVVEIGRLIGL